MPNKEFAAILNSNTKSPVLDFVTKHEIDNHAGDLACTYAATFHPIAWVHMDKSHANAHKDFKVQDAFTGVAFLKTGGEDILTTAAGEEKL